MGAKELVLCFIQDNLSYDDNVRDFVWIADRAGGKIKAGSIAGAINGGYRQVRVYGKWYKSHRLVWLLHTGNWPKDQIDHINKDKLDNRFTNLRDVSNYENCLNRGIKSKSGVVGVTYDKVNNLWLAQTYIKGVAKNLGRYKTIKEAESTYLKANTERA